jgi:hypothetical protein
MATCFSQLDYHQAKHSDTSSSTASYYICILHYITEELLELIPMHGTTTGEDIFCEVQTLLQKYELPLNELLCLVTDGVPELSGCNNVVVGKLNAKVG